MLPSVLEVGSGINLLPCFGRLVCCFPPYLSLNASPDLCWGAGGSSSWLICCPIPALSLCCFMGHHRGFNAKSSIPCHTPDNSAVRDQLFASPLFSRAASVFHHPLPNGSVRLQFTVYGFQFCWGWGVSVRQGAALDYFSRVEG
jgi:hypothetical protein